MKELVLYDYPPSPGGLATQGDLLFKGLLHLGVDAHAVHFDASHEKEWYYRWFQPDVVVGIGYWGHTPHLILHPQRYGVRLVPWLLAAGYGANYHEVLNDPPGRRRCRLEGRPGSHAGTGDDRYPVPSLEIRLQGLATAAHRQSEPARSPAGHPTGDREKRHLYDQ